MNAALAAAGLSRQLGSTAALAGVDIEVRPGEIVALVGLNGAGKTTLLRSLLGMLRPDRGSVMLHGVRLDDLEPRAWSSVGHLVDQPMAYPELTVRRNLRLNATLRGVQDLAGAVRSSVREFALETYGDRLHRRLSAGNRQRVGIAAALIHDPSVIVLDEPTNALDPAGVILVRESLRSRADGGACALVSSHHLDEVARIADRILVMNAGRLIGTLDPAASELERAFFDAVRRDDEVRA